MKIDYKLYIFLLLLLHLGFDIKLIENNIDEN